MNNFNKKLKNLIFDKIPIQKASDELISELKSHCDEISTGVFKVYASSKIDGENRKEFIVDTNESLNIVYYDLRIYEIDENNTSVYYIINWGKDPKKDCFEGLEQICYFEIEYQILKGERVNFITYNTFYS